MKKMIAMLTALALVLSLGVTALAESDFSYEGIVVAGDTVPIAAPFGGRLDGVTARAGSWVAQGDAVGSIKTTLNYAPIEGTVTGLYAEEGDATEEITERYGAVLYIEPTRKYTLEATSEKAFNSSDNYFIHLGERVYLNCISDGSHTGTGFVSALTDSGYTIEVTGGEFYLNEKVYVYREESKKKISRIGLGTVKRSKPVAVKGSGSVLKLHVANGDFVERGELLFETVEGVLDGRYAPDNRILSPVTGVLSEVSKATGDTVAKGDTLMKVIPDSSFQVQFEVPEADLFHLQEGQPVKMELYWDNAASEKTYSGEIIAISHVNVEQKEESDRKVYLAYASFKPDERIRLGMTMLIYPATAEEEEPEAAPAAEPEEEKEPLEAED